MFRGITRLAALLGLASVVAAPAIHAGDDPAHPAAPPVAPTPAAAKPAEVVKFLASWAEAVGADLDATTGYPKKIRRTRDSMVMVLIPAGTFQMGAVPGEDGPSRGATPRHAVTLTKAYYMDESEVTFDMWKKYATDRHAETPHQRSEAIDAHPLQNVSWVEVQGYLQWCGATLPTEGQWERAAKCGHDEYIYPWGGADDVKRRNGIGTDDGFAALAPVKSFAANEYGLYDLAGNVYEWCADWYGKYSAESVSDPQGPAKGAGRVLRGGSCASAVYEMHVSHREAVPAEEGFIVASGFRCAKALP